MSSHFQYPSHLFTLRLWKEPLGGGLVDLRYQVQHVPTGDSRVFRDGEQVLAFLRAKIEEEGQEQQSVGGDGS